MLYCIMQVKFNMSEETNLADLLALNLHNFEEEVLYMYYMYMYIC